MKLNGKTVKVVLAFVIVIGIIFWAVDSNNPRSYAGTNLQFGVGSGPVTMTNPTNVAAAAQLVAAGSRPFSVSSTVEEISGSSTKQRVESKTSQLFEFVLPPGVSVFTVVRGTNVSFESKAGAMLEATVQPISAGEARTNSLVAVVIVLGALFYISRATGHRWINTLRGQKTPAPVAQPLVGPSTLKSTPIRAFGDNRADISE